MGSQDGLEWRPNREGTVSSGTCMCPLDGIGGSLSDSWFMWRADVAVSMVIVIFVVVVVVIVVSVIVVDVVQRRLIM